MKKHAYLIMAHNQWELLNKLLYCIDDERNDIFLHIDRKVKFPSDKIYQPIASKVFYINRINVQWGADSQIRSELNLLKKALSTNQYDYYHLLSGVDLPLKSQDQIHYFFEKNHGKNYIKVDHKALESGYAEERIKYFYFFQNIIGRNKGYVYTMLSRINRILLGLQKKLKINRLNKCPYKIYKGPQWFSITNEMARVLISKESSIKKYFFYSLGGDELFLQTVAMNSLLKDTVVDEDLRCIDWKRGDPYIWKQGDFKYLMSQKNKLFARKFSNDIDKIVIENIVDTLKVTKIEKNV